jgi:acetyl-CoA decarbonylase/synthase, CODH/ACS complex subunit delta
MKPPADKYNSSISEVVLGGGTRNKKFVLGGERAPAYHYFESSQKNKPVIAHDVFDMPISLPGHVKECFKDAMNDPAEWARLRVKKYGAEMITVHMVSTDPKGANVSVSDACKKIEDVLQAVKVPLIIGGSGNPERDPELLEKAAEICSGERILLSTLDANMDYKRVAAAAIKHNHAVMSLIPMNPDEMSRFNKTLMRLGLQKTDIVMDLFTGGVGYGVEYTVSSMERCRLAGLMGDAGLAFPIVSATSNAWSAREAWMRNDAWGARELRGPLWEASTAVSALLSGADLFMMLHPQAIESMEKMIDSIQKIKK